MCTNCLKRCFWSHVPLQRQATSINTSSRSLQKLPLYDTHDHSPRNHHALATLIRPSRPIYSEMTPIPEVCKLSFKFKLIAWTLVRPKLRSHIQVLAAALLSLFLSLISCLPANKFYLKCKDSCLFRDIFCKKISSHAPPCNFILGGPLAHSWKTQLNTRHFNVSISCLLVGSMKVDFSAQEHTPLFSCISFV
jgi:hypothetical protein